MYKSTCINRFLPGVMAASIYSARPVSSSRRVTANYKPSTCIALTPWKSQSPTPDSTTRTLRVHTRGRPRRTHRGKRSPVRHMLSPAYTSIQLIVPTSQRAAVQPTGYTGNPPGRLQTCERHNKRAPPENERPMVQPSR